jgi:hypothetical protein
MMTLKQKVMDVLTHALFILALVAANVAACMLMMYIGGTFAMRAFGVTGFSGVLGVVVSTVATFAALGFGANALFSLVAGIVRWNE